MTTAVLDLLELLAKNPGRVMTRDQQAGIAKYRALSPFDRSIDILVSRIRKKIEPDPWEPKIIRTIRNVGYLFTADVTETRARTGVGRDPGATGISGGMPPIAWTL